MNIIYNVYHTNQLTKKMSNEELYDVINKILYINNSSESKRIDLTPIEIEILMNNKKEVEKLIDKGIDINEISPLGFYPLEVAAFMSNYEITKLLIDNGADVNVGSRCALLNAVVSLKNYEITKLLLESGADVNNRDKFGFNALHYLLDDGRAITKRSYSPYFEFGINMYKKSTDEDIVKIMELLIEKGIDINCVGKAHGDIGRQIDVNPLSIALETSNSKIIKKLIECGADRNAVEIAPSLIYEYQDSFCFISDIMDGDLSLWPEAPKEFIRYLKYKNKIKKFDIDVYSLTMEDGYKRPKMIKKY